MAELIPDCKRCGSSQVIRNGTNGVGNTKYKCKECGFSGVINHKRHDTEQKKQVLEACVSIDSYRDLSKRFGISRQTILRWIHENPSIYRARIAVGGAFRIFKRLNSSAIDVFSLLEKNHENKPHHEEDEDYDQWIEKDFKQFDKKLKKEEREAKKRKRNSQPKSQQVI